MLTKKQKELLDYITVVNKKFGISPSYDEMKDKLKLKSKSGIHRIISALEERGFIRKLANKARAIEIIQNNKNVSPNNETINKIIEIPLYGKIAAGTPIEAYLMRLVIFQLQLIWSIRENIMLLRYLVSQ